MKNWITTIALLCIFASISFAQGDGEKPHDLIPLESGIFTFQVNLTTGTLKYLVTDDKLDSAWHGSLSVPEEVWEYQYKQHAGKIHLLFSWKGDRHFRKEYVFLDLDTRAIKSITIPDALVGKVEDFFILDDRLAFYGNSSLRQAMVQIKDLSNTGRELFTFCIPEMDVWHISEKEGYLDIIATPNLPLRENQLHLLTFDQWGEKVLHVELDRPFDNMYFKSAQIHTVAGDQYRVVGTYSNHKRKEFTGYFHWHLDANLNQNLRVYPAKKLESFGLLPDRKHKKHIKQHLATGFEIVKVLEENGRLALVSIPFDPFLSPRLQMQPKPYHDQFIHFLYLDEEGGILKDRLYNFAYHTQRILIPKDFLVQTPTFLHQGNLYFCHPDALLHENANFTINTINLPEGSQSHQVISLSPNLYFRSKHWKSNELLIYGMQQENNKAKGNPSFFIKKIAVQQPVPGL